MNHHFQNAATHTELKEFEATRYSLQVKQDVNEKYQYQLMLDEGDQSIQGATESQISTEKNLEKHTLECNYPSKKKAEMRTADKQLQKKILPQGFQKERNEIEHYCLNNRLYKNSISETNQLSKQDSESCLKPNQKFDNGLTKLNKEFIGNSFKNKAQVSIGIEDFQELKMGDYFVDKTLLIEEFLQNQCKNIFLIRPRQWGKTQGLNMMFCFFSTDLISKRGIHIFKDTMIWKSKEIDISYLKEFYNRNQKYTEDEEEINLTMIDLDIQDLQEWKDLKKKISGRAKVLLKEGNEEFLNRFRQLRRQYFSESLELLGLTQNQMIFDCIEEAIKMLQHQLICRLDVLGSIDSAKLLGRFSIRRHFNQHPVIQITFTNQLNYDKSNIQYIGQRIIWNLYHEHIDQLLDELIIIENKSTTEEQQQAIIYQNQIKSINESIDSIIIDSEVELLSKILFFVYKKKVIFLIDEFDLLVNSSRKDNEINSTSLKITQNILNQAIQMQEYIFKTFIIGGTRTSMKDLFSDLTQFSIYGVDSSNFSQRFGFLETEIQNLIQKENTQGHITTCQKQDNGYLIGSNTIYNPSSFVKSRLQMQSNQIKIDYLKYLLNTEQSEDFQKAFLSEPSNIDILFNETVTEEIPNVMNLETALTSRKGFFTLLLDAGYLTSTGEENQYRIPNQEVKEFFLENIFPLWISKTNQIAGQPKFIEVLKEISKSFQKYDDFESKLKQRIMPIIEKNKYKEAAFSAIIQSLFWNQKLRINYMASHTAVTNVNIQDINGLFIPVKDISTDVIIQEYKVLQNQQKMDEIIEIVFHQIFDQRLISHPLQLLKHQKKTYSFWRTISVRAIVFSQDLKGKWDITIKEIQLSLKNAMKVDNFFKTYKLIYQQKANETLIQFKNNIKNFLEKNQVRSMDELVKHLIQCTNQKGIFNQIKYLDNPN